MNVAIVRGCGTRSPGGVYLVTELGPYGTPIEDVILDPPIRIDPQATGLTAVGMLLAEGNVLDWVGVEHYPQPADFIEELALFGSSRRIPSSFDFSKLGPGSRHLLVHARASMNNPGWPLRHRPEPDPWPEPSFLAGAMARRGGWCPFNRQHQVLQGSQTSEVCATLWWECLLPGHVQYAPTVEGFEAQVARMEPVLRQMPSFRYRGFCLPDNDIWLPDWEPAIFLQLPINRIEIVRDPGNQKLVDQRRRKAERAALPVEEVDA